MLGAVVIVVACEDTAAPEEETCPEAAVRLCFTTTDTVVAAVAAVMDIAERSTKGLTSGGPRSQIESSVPSLVEALSNGRVTAARDALADLREGIAAARAASNPRDEPDLAAIELALLVIDRLL